MQNIRTRAQTAKGKAKNSKIERNVEISKSATIISYLIGCFNHSLTHTHTHTHTRTRTQHTQRTTSTNCRIQQLEKDKQATASQLASSEETRTTSMQQSSHQIALLEAKVSTKVGECVGVWSCLTLTYVNFSSKKISLCARVCKSESRHKFYFFRISLAFFFKIIQVCPNPRARRLVAANQEEGGRDRRVCRSPHCRRRASCASGMWCVCVCACVCVCVWVV